MKHLRRFNESNDDWELEKEEFQDFCDTYLAYLIDEGFKTHLENFDKDKKTFYFTKEGEKGGWPYNPDLRVNDPFGWDEIKDTFIPFLSFLKKKYSDVYYIGDVPTISEELIFSKEGDNLILFDYVLNGRAKYEYIPVDDAINDKINFESITSIQFSLYKK